MRKIDAAAPEWQPEIELDEISERRFARNAVQRALGRGLSRAAALECYGYRNAAGQIVDDVDNDALGNLGD